jgi:hypothetical protein
MGIIKDPWFIRIKEIDKASIQIKARVRIDIDPDSLIPLLAFRSTRPMIHHRISRRMMDSDGVVGLIVIDVIKGIDIVGWRVWRRTMSSDM